VTFERASAPPAIGRAASRALCRKARRASARQASGRQAASVEEHAKAKAELPLPTKVQTVEVTPDEDNMRVDRFLEGRFPGLSFSHIQRIVRKGGAARETASAPTARTGSRPAQSVRLPTAAARCAEDRRSAERAESRTLQQLKERTLFEDDDVMVLNKPSGACGAGRLRHGPAMSTR